MKIETMDNNKSVMSLSEVQDSATISVLETNRQNLQNVVGCHIIGVATQSISELILDHEAMSFITAFRASVDIRPLSDEHYIELPLTFPKGRIRASDVAEQLSDIANISNRYETEFDFTLSKPLSIMLLLYNFCNNNNDIKPVGVIQPKLVLDKTEAENIITLCSSRDYDSFLAFHCSANVLELRVTPTRITVIKSSNYTLTELLNRSLALYQYYIGSLTELPMV